MQKLLLTVTATLLISALSNADIVVIPDTPNTGDTTTITTVTSGNPVTTNNLISQNWIDGSWVGTMFPDSSDINENTWLTGKDDKYAETTLNSEDYVSIEELQQGFTSNFGAQIRWWNNVESTVTMTQSISNGIDTTTQSTTFEDTTNSSYQVNPYGNVLVVNPDADMTHGTATYRFDFDIINDNQAGYNGGHAGVDVRDPTAVIDYTALSSTTVTTVEYCWQKNPPTCPGQDEIEAVENIIEEIDTIIVDFEVPEDIFLPEYIEIDYEFNDVFKDDIVIEEDTFEVLALDEFFFEEDYFETDYYQEPELEIFLSEDIVLVENVEMFDELPPIDMFEEMPIIEEVYEAVPMEEMFTEEFTEEMQEEFIDDVEEYFEEITMEEPQPEVTPEPMEEIAMVEEEIIQEEPIEEEIVQEESIQEETTEEVANEIEEQPSSEEPIADKPEPTTEIAEQKEAIEKPSKAEPTGDLEVNLEIKVAKIEQAIQGKIKDVAQQIDATLTVVNEIVSREMISQQPNMSSYFNANLALFDTRQLPSGNQDFFLQNSLDSYSKPIYVAQANIAGTDPVVQHQIKVNEAKQKTNDAYRKLKELINARNVQ